MACMLCGRNTEIPPAPPHLPTYKIMLFVGINVQNRKALSYPQSSLREFNINLVIHDPYKLLSDSHNYIIHTEENGV